MFGAGQVAGWGQPAVKECLAVVGLRVQVRGARQPREVGLGWVAG